MNDSSFLTQEQRERLQNLASSDGRGHFRRRAEILLAYDQGLSTSAIARQLHISPRLARYWRQAFAQKGMAVFLENDAPAAPPAQAHAVLPEVRLEKPKPRKNAGLSPDDEAYQAGVKVFRFQLNLILANEDGTRKGEDIEALHDMRVATRRLRAAFEVFAPYFPAKAIKSLRKDIRTVGRALGNVRDLDVFLEKTTLSLETLSAAQRERAMPLLEYFKERREEMRSQLLMQLDSDTYHQFLHKFDTFLEQPPLPPAEPVRVCQIAPVLIYARLADVRAFSGSLETASFERLHSLRTSFKYFRYTLEFFREVLGSEIKNALDELKAIQDHLGNLNDANVACNLISTFLSEWEARQEVLPFAERHNPDAVIACLAARSSERHILLTTFPQAWEQFNRPDFRRNLALAVSVL